MKELNNALEEIMAKNTARDNWALEQSNHFRATHYITDPHCNLYRLLKTAWDMGASIEQRRRDALAKLTPDERQLLGLS